MSNNKLSQKEQAKIVEKLISRIETMGPEDDFDEELFEQLDDEHKMQVDEAIREFADGAIGDENWDSDK